MTVPAIYSSTALEVAGDTAYDAESDAYDGSAVKVEPSAGQLAQGLFRPGRQIPGQEMNWLNQQFAAIMSQLIVDTAVQDARLDTDEAELVDHEARVTAAESWITNNSPRLRIFQFLATGTIVVPPRCVAGMVFGCGGGGAGGNGAQGVAVSARTIAGGAGGGGALAAMLPLFNLTPGETLNVVVGDGGAPTSSGNYGATGADGGDTYVARGLTQLATFLGAQGGRGSVGVSLQGNWIHYTMGGLPVRSQQIMLIGPTGQGIRWSAETGGSIAPFGNTGQTGGQIQSFYVPMQPAQGGFGASSSAAHVVTSAPGCLNPVGGFAGGLAGDRGVDGDPNTPPGDTTKWGGGGGGGGGAGPFGVGGNGGLGDAGQAHYANGGGTAAANTGSGGGGGGSGGYHGGPAGAVPDTGGGGGSGRCYVIFILESLTAVAVT